MPLTRDEVLTAALAIVDDYGLADLTMRRLASQLQVQPGALYYHVANKQTLLIHLADRVLAGLPEPTDDLVAWGLAMHDLLRQHRSGAELVSAAVAMRPWPETPGYRLAEVLAPTWGQRARPVAEAVVHVVVGHTFDAEQREQFAGLGAAEVVNHGGRERLATALAAWRP